ncbi:MAG: hypothetical protein ACN4GW_06965 [Desulforhopalus sp.]
MGAEIEGTVITLVFYLDRVIIPEIFMDQFAGVVWHVIEFEKY